MTSVLVVDDNETDRERVRRLLRGPYEVREASTGTTGIASCAADPPDCVVLDHRLPDVDGVDLIARLLVYDVALVMSSGQGSEELAVVALKRGAHDYVAKDRLTEDALRSAVRHAIEARDLRRQVRRQQEELARRAAELTTSEARLRLLVDQLPCVVWTTDLGLVVSSVSGARDGSMFADDPVGGAPWPHVAEVHARALAADGHARASITLQKRHAEVEVRPLRAPDGERVGFVGVAVDTTERRRLEDQLRHSQKMEAIGQLAGGVAHDFNNLLTCIVGFATLAREQVADPTTTADLDEVIGAAQRAGDLTRQLLAVARRRPSEAQVVAPGVAVEGMRKMLARLLGSSIEVRTQLPTSVWRIRIDPSWLEQIVLNLAVNARDAMPSGGTLLVDLQNTTCEVPIADARGETAPPGRYLRLMVADTGVGMTADVRERIFDPFFTTKAAGEGTGLGLATVYGIVRQLGGVVQVYSEPGQGAAFRVWLPAAPDQDEERGPVLTRNPRAGTERVVVVEDDPAIHGIALRTLAGAGYRVTVVPDGESALGLLDAGCDLLLADVVTRGITVAELIRRVRDLPAPPRTALMTGWSPLALHGGAVLAGLPILEKPFTPRDLLSFVADVLDRRAR